jgi:hypothetical protein
VASGNDKATILNNEGRLRDVLLKEEKIYLLTSNRDGRGIPRMDDDLLLEIVQTQ